MSKKNKKGRGSASALTLVIRALIVLIFIVALIIAFNRVGEVMQNNQKKEKMQQGALPLGATTLCLDPVCSDSLE